MGIRCFKIGLWGGWYGQLINISYPVFRPDQQPPQPESFTSRGNSPNYGSGPYFKAQGSVNYYDSDSHDQFPPSHQTLYAGNKRGEFFVKEEDGCYATYHLTYVDDVLDSGYKTIRRFYWDTPYPFSFDYAYYSYVKATDSWLEEITYSDTSDGWPVDVEYVSPSGYEDLYGEFLMATEADYFPNYLENINASLYLDACDSIPQSSVNVMANVYEIFNYIKALTRAIKNPATTISQLARELSDPRKAWLAYRYTYQTTLSDIRDYDRTLSGLNYLSLLDGKDVRYSATTTVAGVDRRVSLAISSTNLLPDGVQDAIKRLGGIPSLADVWDMIPYSFVADWFVQLGSILERWDQWEGVVNLQPSEIWYSAFRAQSTGGFVYYRVSGHVPICPPLYKYHSVSGQTWTMRIADSIALFT